MRILINGIGGPTPRSIARTIKRYCDFGDVELYGTDINPNAYGLYEDDLYKETFLVPGAGKPGYWASMKQIIQSRAIDFALVQPELEVMEWTRYAAEGNTLPCKVLLPDHNVAELLVDKSKMTEVLDGTDLVPISIDIDPKKLDFEAIEEKLPYPFWIRSTAGSSGLGSLKVTDRSALKNWIIINPGVKMFIGSTFLPGRNLACKLLYHNGELLRSACAERVHYIMAKVAPSGITGNTSYGRLLNEPDLVAKATAAMDRIFAATGCEKHGFFTADFKEDEGGKPFLTEINVRMVAFNMSFAAGGANFTSDIIRLLSDDESFDRNYKMYEFEPDTIFLRDVDAEPKLLKEGDIKQKYQF